MRGVENVKIYQYEDRLIQLSKELIFYLIKMGSTKEDAQDIAQEVFVKILETELILPMDKVKAWMYRVAIRKYLDLYRRKKRYSEIIEENFLSLPNWQLQPEQNELLYIALNQLDPSSASLLIMKYEQELSIKEMMSILDASESKIKSDLFRARKKLVQILEKEGY